MPTNHDLAKRRALHAKDTKMSSNLYGSDPTRTFTTLGTFVTWSPGDWTMSSTKVKDPLYLLSKGLITRLVVFGYAPEVLPEDVEEHQADPEKMARTLFRRDTEGVDHFYYLAQSLVGDSIEITVEGDKELHFGWAAANSLDVVPHEDAANMSVRFIDDVLGDPSEAGDLQAFIKVMLPSLEIMPEECRRVVGYSRVRTGKGSRLSFYAPPYVPVVEEQQEDESEDVPSPGELVAGPSSGRVTARQKRLRRELSSHNAAPEAKRSKPGLQEEESEEVYDAYDNLLACMQSLVSHSSEDRRSFQNTVQECMNVMRIERDTSLSHFEGMMQMIHYERDMNHKVVKELLGVLRMILFGPIGPDPNLVISLRDALMEKYGGMMEKDYSAGPVVVSAPSSSSSSSSEESKESTPRPISLTVKTP